MFRRAQIENVRSLRDGAVNAPFHDRRVRFQQRAGMAARFRLTNVLSDEDWNHESRERLLLFLFLSRLEAKRSSLPGYDTYIV